MLLIFVLNAWFVVSDNMPVKSCTSVRQESHIDRGDTQRAISIYREITVSDTLLSYWRREKKRISLVTYLDAVNHHMIVETEDMVIYGHGNITTQFHPKRVIEYINVLYIPW